MIFVGIIGNRNSGKSTIIQSLTGCQTASYRDYICGLRDQSVYVCASSPQESIFKIGRSSNISAIRTLLRQVLNRNGCRGIIMAIQPNRPHSRPSMDEIYREVISQGFDAVYGFPIDPGFRISSSVTDSVIERLSSVHTSIGINRLRGYHFPLVNANKINKLSNIIY